MEEYNKMLGAKIVFYRNLRGFTQKCLAAELGISRQYLSKIEHGKVTCKIILLEKIAALLNIDIIELLKEKT